MTMPFAGSLFYQLWARSFELAQLGQGLRPLIPTHDGGCEAAASSYLAEIGKFDLRVYGPPERADFLAPGPDIVRHGLYAGFDFSRFGEIAFEGGFGAG